MKRRLLFLGLLPPLWLAAGGCSRDDWPEVYRSAGCRLDASGAEKRYGLRWGFSHESGLSRVLSADEVCVFVDDLGRAEVRGRYGLPHEHLYLGALGFELSAGTNQDGDGWAASAALKYIWWDLVYEKIDRESFRRDRFLACLPLPVFWRKAWDAYVVLAPGYWVGDTDQPSQAEDDEGWCLSLVTVRDSDGRTGARLDKIGVSLRIDHDSADGTEADLVVRNVARGLDVHLGYAAMRWGEGPTAGLDWVF